MSNVKVRIYELSRELSLENKDLLTICDRLNIAAKSHSSTITETDAERIRSAAKTYSSKASSNRPAPIKKGVTAKSANVRPSNKRKPQILEIRKSPSSPAKSQDSESPTAPVSRSSPTLPSPTTAPPSPSPLAPKRPSRPSPQPAISESPTIDEDTSDSAALEVEVSSLREESSETKDAAISSPEAPPDKPSPPVRLKRPVARSSEVETPTSPEQRPIPRIVERKQSQQQQESSPGANDRDGNQVTAPPAPQRPRLVKPPSRPVSRLNKASDVSESQETAAVSTESGNNATDSLELKRPSTPRTSKRAKHWEEEEEQEIPAKSAKSFKSKRRLQPIIEDEDEEDLDIANDSAVSPVQVSLSLARPPKPKSKPGNSGKSSSAASASTPKKSSSSSRGGGSNRRSRKERAMQDAQAERPEKLVLSGSLTVQELASEIAVAETEIIKTLFFKGIAVNITETLDIPTIEMVAQEFDIAIEIEEEASAARKVTEMLEVGDLENLQLRPPVVTIMGHVDHGKTTLLDSIRKTKVAQGEAGGITQHIGAYHVDVEHGEKIQQIVFLDTPGHEAFTAMRARGTRVTDIAILVVAADDGVRPQTVEAISHAKAAGVPVVVAINKIDKEGAQPDRVMQELTEYGLVPEAWGGDTVMTTVSALKGENLDTLLEMLLLVSELEELSANPNRPARGTVIEAHLDKAKGSVATLLIQNGTLRVGDALVAGSVFGRVKAMMDDRGQRVESATPSFAVEVLGLSDVPAAGEEFEVFEEEREARSVASERASHQRQSRLQQAMASRRVTLGTLSARAQEGELKELNLILKADVQGSVEAILGSLEQLPQDQVQIRVLLSAPGEITETDVDLAAASDAVIVGFNTTLASGARRAADEAGIDVREYSVIYKLLEDIQGAMEGLLEPELVPESLGRAEVRAVFPVGRGAVAGCYVLSGKMVRNCKVKVHRNEEMVYEGSLDSLKRIKEDVKEVNTGFECGIRVDGFNAWEEGDVIEAFQLVTKRRTLASA